jgi:hypothetical protein
LGIALLANPKLFGIVIEWMQKKPEALADYQRASKISSGWKEGEERRQAQEFRSDDLLTMKLEVKPPPGQRRSAYGS